MNSRDDPLFKQYPLGGSVNLSTGPAPEPYHVYDGYGLFVGGEADLAAARRLLAREQVTCIRNSPGQRRKRRGSLGSDRVGPCRAEPSEVLETSEGWSPYQKE
jgi:hypothetical protein